MIGMKQWTRRCEQVAELHAWQNHRLVQEAETITMLAPSPTDSPFMSELKAALRGTENFDPGDETA